MLIAIEGVDGAGKRTLTDGLRTVFESQQKSVATLAFPRYKHSITADLAAEALHGGHGDLADSVYAMAVLFALDRADARDEIAHLTGANDVVILDRYVASNAAYSAARLHQGVDGDVVAWVRDLEYDRLELPKPDWQVLLDGARRAGRRARGKARPARRRPRQGCLRTRRRAAAADGGRLQRARRGALVRPLGRRTSRRRRDGPRGRAGGSVAGSKSEPAAQIPVNTQNTRVVAGLYRDLVTPWTP